VEDWAEIRRLRRGEGLAISVIARRLGVSRNTVKRALASDRPPRYQRPAKGSIVDGVEPQIRALLREFPSMPATVIAERIGWARGKTVLCDRVAQLRALYRPVDPAQRTDYLPGELAQCDLWFPPVDVPLGWGQVGRPPVLVMVCGYSRWLSAVMIPSRQSPDLLAGQWQLIAALGVVPKALVWDNETAIGKWHRGRPQLTTAMTAFRGTLGISVIQCRPRDPESKGLVERANGYLETSFLPGRRFASPTDFNTQLAGWIARANQRQHRRLGCRPVDRFDADRAAMLSLPPVAPVVGWRLTTRLPRDRYVRVAANDYSVDPAVIGRWVDITADPQRVQVCCAGRLVAEHERCWAAHQTITDPAHRQAAAALRASPPPQRSAARLAEVEQRRLDDYDRAFHLDRDEAVA
jgi:transposase